MKKPTKRGPEAQTLKIEGNWEDAVRVALSRKRPPGGWPKPAAKPKAKKRKAKKK
jgi:hypothetical protein